MGKYEEAIQCYDKALQIEPRNAFAWNNKGLSLDKLGKYEEAIKSYDESIRIKPENTDVWYNMGNVLDKLGKYEEAIQCYDKALQIEPNRTDVLNAKGLSLTKLGKIEEAENLYKHTLDRDPNNIITLQGLKLLFSDYAYEYDKALQVSRRLLEVNPNQISKIYYAESLIETKDYTQGRKFAKEILNEIQDDTYETILRFLILTSYLLEKDEINGEKELFGFLGYCRNTIKDLKVNESQWLLKGLNNIVNRGGISWQTKFILHTLIDMIRGKIDKDSLSIISSIYI